MKVRDIFTREFGDDEWWAVDFIIQKESGWNQYAINSMSGACGFFQMLPCSKMNCKLDDARCQAWAGVNYIKNRYLTPTGGYNFWIVNFWY